MNDKAWSRPRGLTSFSHRQAFLFVATDWKRNLKKQKKKNLMQKQILAPACYKLTVGSTLSCKHSAEFRILIWPGFEYGTFCMRGELSTHRRVIIGSLWSTWRLRAQRKQLSLHSTLDCLSQQTSFPSPLHLFFKFPPRNNLLHRMKEQGRDTVCLLHRHSWMRKACVLKHSTVS